MGEGTREIREEIEQTRSRVGDEVEALTYKTDVGARMDDYVEEKKEAVVSTVSGAKEAVTSTVASVIPSGDGVKRRGRRVAAVARRNPLGLVVGSAAAGFVAGLLLPSTDVEDEKLGDVAERVKETARETGHEALERGKDVAQSALDTVKQDGAEQGRELASELKDRVQHEQGAPTAAS